MKIENLKCARKVHRTEVHAIAWKCFFLQFKKTMEIILPPDKLKKGAILSMKTICITVIGWYTVVKRRHFSENTFN